MTRLRRDQWNARPPARRQTVWDWDQIEGIEVHHSVTPASRGLIDAMIGIQNYHMDKRRYRDIFYNEAIHIAGNRAEGRAWGAWGVSMSQVEDTDKNPTPYLTVVVLGNYNVATPSQAILDRIQDIRKEVHGFGGGTELHWHSQRDSTGCPGSKLVPSLERLADEPLVDPDVVPPAMGPYPCPGSIVDIRYSKTGARVLFDTGHVFTFGGYKHIDGPGGQPYFEGHEARRFVDDVDLEAWHLYAVEDQHGHVYHFEG